MRAPHGLTWPLASGFHGSLRHTPSHSIGSVLFNLSPRAANRPQAGAEPADVSPGFADQPDRGAREARSVPAKSISLGVPIMNGPKDGLASPWAVGVRVAVIYLIISSSCLTV